MTEQFKTQRTERRRMYYAPFGRQKENAKLHRISLRYYFITPLHTNYSCSKLCGPVGSPSRIVYFYLSCLSPTVVRKPRIMEMLFLFTAGGKLYRYFSEKVEHTLILIFFSVFRASPEFCSSPIGEGVNPSKIAERINQNITEDE